MVQYSVWIRFAILALLNGLSISDDGEVKVLVEHSFGGQVFTKRGYVKLIKPPGGGQKGEYVGAEWTKNDQQELLNSAKNGLMYTIRAPVRFDTEVIAGDAYVMSSVPACHLAKSQLNDRINLAIDSSRQRVISISSFPLTSNANCQSIDEDLILEEFNTTVRLVDVVEGPIPETQAYLQKVEREKQDRQRGEQGDNRSFLAKYWMYIVPVVIVLMLSSAMNPDAQGGGGNRH